MSNRPGRYINIQTLFYFSLETLLMIGILIFSVYLCYPERTYAVVQEDHFLSKAATFIFIILISLYLLTLYEDKSLRSNFLEFSPWQIFKTLAVAAFVLSFIYYVLPDLAIEREIFILSFLMIATVSIIFRTIYQRVLETSREGRNVLIIGSGSLATDIVHEIEKQNNSMYRVVGFITNDPESTGKKILAREILGNYSNIIEVVSEKKVNQIIVALDERRGGFPLMQLLECKVSGLRIEPGVDFYERLTGRLKIKNLLPSTLIFSRGFRKSAIQLALKRIIELVMSFAGLIVLAPVMLVIAVLIKLESPGPAFYRQVRVGQHGKNFELIKFRSMHMNAEADGPVWAKENDNRVTRIGKWLRKLRLDELPQLINVIKGEMSFVGPRPERPHFVNMLRREIPFYDQRLSVKPGVTGWAQIKYSYAGSNEETMEKMTYDLYYIKNLSIALDFLIMFETVMVVLFRKGSR